jgi:hypothetical protein
MASSVSSVEGSPVAEKKESGRGERERGTILVSQDGLGRDAGEREKVVLEDIRGERGKKEKGEKEKTTMTWAERARGGRGLRAVMSR